MAKIVIQSSKWNKQKNLLYHKKQRAEESYQKIDKVIESLIVKESEKETEIYKTKNNTKGVNLSGRCLIIIMLPINRISERSYLQACMVCCVYKHAGVSSQLQNQKATKEKLP